MTPKTRTSVVRVALIVCFVCIGCANNLPVLADVNSVIRLNNEGVKALNTANFDLAISKFEEALKEDPNYGLARENLAITQNRYGLKFAKETRTASIALSHFHSSAFLNSQNRSVLENVNGMLIMLGKDPRSFSDRVKLADEARKQNDFIGAYIEYREALNLGQDNEIKSRLVEVTRALADQGLTPYSGLAKDILSGRALPLQVGRESTVVATPILSASAHRQVAFMFDVQSKIKRSWNPPASMQSSRTIVTFTIGQSGLVSDEKIKASSGEQFVDSAALKAVRDASPFIAEGHKLTEPITVEFNFDYKVFGGGDLPTRTKGSYGVEYDLDPPNRTAITDLTVLEKQFLAKAEALAESYEIFGRFAEARKMYEKMLAVQGINNDVGEEMQTRIRLKRDRIARYESARKMTDATEFEPVLLQFLEDLAADTSITQVTCIGIQKQLAEDAIRCKIKMESLSKILNNSKLPITIRYSFAGLLQKCAIQNRCPIEQIRSLDAIEAHYRDKIINLAWAEELCNLGFHHEKSGDYEDAIGFYRKSSSIRLLYLGVQDAEALTMNGYIARVLANQGKISLSQQVFKRTYDLFKKLGNPDDQYVRFLEMYGDVLAQNKIEPRASEIYNEAVEVWKQIRQR